MFIQCKKDQPITNSPNPNPVDTTTKVLKIESLQGGGKDFLISSRLTDIDRNFKAVITFNKPVDPTSLNTLSVRVVASGFSADVNITLSDSNKTLNLQLSQPLDYLNRYSLNLSKNITGENGETFDGYQREFYTALDTTPKYPLISDAALLDKVEEQTFKYFWDFAHPVSGLARERNTSGETVTIGGSGFGVMAILVGIERNFITRAQGVTRLKKIVDFLAQADRFHGAWPHWINGTTGHVVPFSSNDNGADLVETSYMIEGLLTARQYLDSNNATEDSIITKIDTLWHQVEWDWFTQNGQNVLYWHWSPDKGWIMNMQIKGYNEALIVYVLAASSPTHPISKAVYDNGWASNGGIVNGNSYYGISLPVGQSYGGPLFFAHYSFLGLDPTNLSDNYANYWTQNVHHTQINRAYCINNPKNYLAYSSKCWGLTASDNSMGYSAHSPTNDLGVITPTAALSSMPYTPQESMEALKFFYYTMGDRLWGPYGFYDAFNVTKGWYASSYLAIDQGPIIDMIENYRSGLLWNNFMTAPEIQSGLTKLGFTY